jgi:hypothetical protein
MKMNFVNHSLALATLAWLGLAGLAPAQIITSATVQGSGLINPGESFTVSLALDNSSGANLVGVTYFVSLVNPSGTGEFSLTGRDLAGSPFTDLSTSDAVALSAPSNLLDPINNSDLGALDSTLVGVGNGTWVIADLTITSEGGVTPGSYTFQLFGDDAGTIPVQVADTSFASLDAGSPSFSITVVPEPSTPALVLLAAGLLAGLKRKGKSL